MRRAERGEELHGDQARVGRTHWPSLTQAITK